MDIIITLGILGIGYMYYTRFFKNKLGGGNQSSLQQTLDDIKNELREVRLELVALKEKLTK